MLAKPPHFLWSFFAKVVDKSYKPYFSVAHNHIETDSNKGNACLENERVTCEYFSEDGSCKAIIKNLEGKALRDESCVNEMWDSCCYTCPHQETCEISCNYLGSEKKQEPRKISQVTRINYEITKYKKSIEKLSVFFAEGKISEESYLRSVRGLESKINDLKELKKNPEALDSKQHPSRLNDEEYDSVEKPSGIWYLVPFLFGLIGGIIGYVGTKDRDEDMAFGLLLFGIIWTFVLLIIGWTLINSF
jgi:hypothetical protein